jgi:hypothetical protein
VDVGVGDENGRSFDGAPVGRRRIGVYDSHPLVTDSSRSVAEGWSRCRAKPEGMDWSELVGTSGSARSSSRSPAVRCLRRTLPDDIAPPPRPVRTVVRRH